MAERELAAAVSRQLVLVRSLLDKAKRSALEADDIGLMSAMLLADIAVETLVKLVLFDRGAEPNRQDKLAKLLDDLTKSVPTRRERLVDR
jgi:HEPN domain-containing protein